MAKGSCDQAGCTVADTGICLLSHADLSACPHFRTSGSFEEAIEPASPAPELTDLLPLPGSAARRFPSGLELGTEDAAEIMRARYTYLVGILGSWNAGKTCFLLSLYLMASRGALPRDYLFAGSESLQGFEARARRIREWKGGPLPEQLADHTNLTDPRQPAFLHLALRESGGAKALFDIILTDLPGEWSTNLIDRAATADRFMFLRRADGIIIVVDGPLLNSNSRHSELQRSKYLLERIVKSIGVETTVPLVLAVSKCDELQMQDLPAVDELELHAKALGFSPEVIRCAAFSKIPETVQNGLGVFEALERILASGSAPRCATTSPHIAEAGARSFLNFSYRTK